MRRRLCGLLLALGGCFETEAPAEPEPVDVCRECAAMKCAQYHDPCAADGECNDCFGAAKNLECLANTLFHPAANCACEECASECGYMCPGGEGACDACSIESCSTEGNACIGDPTCAPCLVDPFRPECASNPNYMAADVCACTNCGQECIWTCPEAGNTCASCVSMACGAAFGDCLQLELCASCFENPSGDGCDANPEYLMLHDCLCASCPEVCGVLFECG